MYKIQYISMSYFEYVTLIFIKHLSSQKVKLKMFPQFHWFTGKQKQFSEKM